MRATAGQQVSPAMTRGGVWRGRQGGWSTTYTHLVELLIEVLLVKVLQESGKAGFEGLQVGEEEAAGQIADGRLAHGEEQAEDDSILQNDHACTTLSPRRIVAPAPPASLLASPLAAHSVAVALGVVCLL